jgi:hypothetical protein
MSRPRQEKKIKLSVTVRPFTRTLLEQLAADRGLSVSQAVEDIVLEADGEAAYFRKQAAFHGFLAAALSAALAGRVLGPDATRELQERAAATARRLYGRSPARPFEVDQGFPEDSDDPRVWALFAAFGVGG